WFPGCQVGQRPPVARHPTGSSPPTHGSLRRVAIRGKCSYGLQRSCHTKTDVFSGTRWVTPDIASCTSQLKCICVPSATAEHAVIALTSYYPRRTVRWGTDIVGVIA